MAIHNCPICDAQLDPNPRYPMYVCNSCASRAKSEDGRPLRFDDEDISGGFLAEYADTGESYDSRRCFIDGKECRADEARFGGIVIERSVGNRYSSSSNLSINSKLQQYKALVAQRKKCRLCVGLSNPAERRLRRFDSDQIGPWSRLHGDLDAELMVVAQDWGDVDYFNRNRGLDDLKNPTMQNLEKLLKHIGLNVSITTYSGQHRGLFLTNSILCLKEGGLQAKVNPEWVKNCGNHFLRQQIEIIRPKVVVGLGKCAYHAVLRAFGHPLVGLREAIEDRHGCEVLHGVRLFAAYHCGARTININRDFRHQCKDWKRIQKALQSA